MNRSNGKELATSCEILIIKMIIIIIIIIIIIMMIINKESLIL